MGLRDVERFGAKVLSGARGLGRKFTGLMRIGTKMGRKILGAGQSAVDTVQGIPVVGSLAKPVLEPAKAVINMGNRILKGGERVLEGADEAIEARSLGDLKRAGGKIEDAYRNF